MDDDTSLATALSTRLTGLLAGGLSSDPVEHARQVAGTAAVLQEAFEPRGFRVTLVGGSAIEVHAPGIYMSGDIDVVIERRSGATGERDRIFESLGFERMGRHWVHGELFVETVAGPVAGPAEDVEIAGAAFRVVRKEVLLRDRIVGFKHWRHTAYGDQAIAMLVAFGDRLDRDWLERELRAENALNALEALEALARADTSVTHERLLALTDDLKR